MHRNLQCHVYGVLWWMIDSRKKAQKTQSRTAEYSRKGAKNAKGQIE
jgi:hypothetical protein